MGFQTRVSIAAHSIVACVAMEPRRLDGDWELGMTTSGAGLSAYRRARRFGHFCHKRSAR